jgi:hypothetical protein
LNLSAEICGLNLLKSAGKMVPMLREGKGDLESGKRKLEFVCSLWFAVKRFGIWNFGKHIDKSFFSL